MAFVLFAESFENAILVFPNALAQIARHSDVEYTRDACDHIHEVMTLTPHSFHLTVIPTK
jgi:hypothetical protein